MAHAVGLAFVASGCVVIAAAGAAVLLVRGDLFTRLHFLTPVTSLGAPLVGIGLCIESGHPWVIAELLVIVGLLFVSGPVLESATGRVAAQERGVVSEGQPE